MLTALALAVGCAPYEPTPSIADGIVIAADGPNAAQVDRFTLRTATGGVLAFTVGTLDVADGGLPAPHIREHLVGGDPIRVFYFVENGANVAFRYTDAPE